MKKTAKQLMSLLLAAVLCLGLAACGGSGTGGSSDASTGTPETNDASTATQAPQTTDTPAPEESTGPKHVENLVIGTRGDVMAVNLLSQDGAMGRFQYNSITNPTFFYLDENNEIKGYFVTDYEISEDGCELTLTFPTDKVWHDGVPVTADDVVFTFEYKRDLGAASLKNVTEVRVDAENQVTVVFSEPDAYYWVRSSPITQQILCKHTYEGVEDYKSFTSEESTIGCGPYRIASVDSDAGVMVFEAVPQNAYLGELTVDKITLRSYSSKDTLLMALANGEIDLIYDYASSFSHTLLDLVNGNENIDIGQSANKGCNQVTFGMANTANQSLEFRQAVVRSIDWELVRELINGEYGSVPGSGVIPPTNVGYDDSLWKFYTDLDEAKQLLDEAGFADVNGDGFRELPDGTEFTYKVTSQLTSARQDMFNRCGEILVDGLKKIGVNAYYDTESLSSSEANKAMVADNAYDLFIGYTTSSVASYNTAIWYFLNRAVAGRGACEWGNSLDDEELNDAYRALQDANSDAEYVEAVRGLQKIMSEKLYGFALCWEDCFFPYRTDRLEGLKYFPGIGVVNQETFYRVTEK